MTTSNHFNCRMDKTTRAMLEELATREGKTKARILRDMIHARHGMHAQNVPLCATGDPCIMAPVWLQNRQAALQLQTPPPIPRNATTEPDMLKVLGL